MSLEHRSRLERAMSAFLRFRSEGGERGAFLDAHEELRDLLEPMLAENDADAGDPGAGDLADTVLGADFRLEQEIGRGGSGVVYAARQISLGRKVAVKVLPRHLLLSPSTITRFRREAKTIATLSHPGIVRVLAVGTDAHTHWFAMELVEGRSLAALLDELRASGQPAPWTRRMVQMVAHVADALHYVHELGVVHRDVKPSNVLLRHDATPVLTDFGLAHVDDAPTITFPGGGAGTPCYMAPEQITDAADVDRRSDVFALGATLHEVLTFERAFDAGSPDRSLRRVLDDEPPDPRRLNPAVSRDLAAVVATALAKDPGQRYQTAAAFADDLRACLAHRPIRARRPSLLVRIARWARRQPGQAGFAATMALVVPTIAALAAFVVARAPLVRAGEQRRLEELIDQGFHFSAHSERDQPKARAALEEALRLAPEDPEVLLATVQMLGRWDGCDAVLRFLDDRQELCARFRELRRAKALYLELHGRTDEMQRIEAELGEPRNALEHYLAGVVSFRRGTVATARQSLRHFSLASRLSPRPRLFLALALADAADLADDAAAREESVTTLTTLWPDSSRAWGRVAWVLRRVDPRRAKEASDRALALYPDEPGLMMCRGLILEQLGDRDGALRLLERFTIWHDADVDQALVRLRAGSR